MKVIIHAVQIGSSPDKVYKAITTGEGLAGWWSTHVEAQEELGGIVQFRFQEGFNPHMKITAIDAGKRLDWECVDGHKPWLRNTFRFDLTPTANGTLLMFRQDYAQELSDEEYGTYNFNWAYYLASLKKLVDDGEGTPFQPS